MPGTSSTGLTEALANQAVALASLQTAVQVQAQVLSKSMELTEEILELLLQSLGIGNNVNVTA